jgi:hypothetical protein
VLSGLIPVAEIDRWLAAINRARAIFRHGVTRLDGYDGKRGK